MASQQATKSRLDRAAHPMMVKVNDIEPHPVAQREYREKYAEELASRFELEEMSQPVLNEKGGRFYSIDGQHTLGALRILGFGEDKVQCLVYHDLTDEQCAEKFLNLNNKKSVSAYEKFDKGRVAGRKEDLDIDAIVRFQGLHISSYRSSNVAGSLKNVSCVDTLRKVYRRAGATGLGRTLRIIRDAYGGAGLEAVIIDGISLVVHRYDSQVDDKRLIEQLGKALGGLNGLMEPARLMKLQTGQPMNQCIAAAAVDLYNKPRNGRVSAWWNQG